MNTRVRRTRIVTVVLAAGLVGLSLSGCPRSGQVLNASTGPTLTGSGLEAGFSAPVADPLYPQYGNPALDVLQYQLVLSWSPPRKELTGTATLVIRAARPVSELALDFSDSYTVDGASVDGTAVKPSRRDNDLVVPAPQPLAIDARTTLIVRYHGTPRTVPMPSGRNDFAEGLGLRVAANGDVWTMQEPFGAFTWYPANDHPSDEALYDVAVTVPKGLVAVAHGHLDGVDLGEGSDTYSWRSVDPVASYLATLAIGHYTKLTDTGPHGLPVTYWLRTGKDEKLEPVLRRTPTMLTWLEDHFGPYPFPTAGVVVVDSDSAMETQQMVTLGAGRDRVPIDRPEIEPHEVLAQTLLHELAHQWFGNSVTLTSWRDLWLNEGWAMYAQWLWEVDTRHESDAEWVAWARSRDANARPFTGPPGNPSSKDFGEIIVYAGPALMLHDIHHAVGDQEFFALARDWVQTQRNQPVDRADFVAFVNHHTGRDFTSHINGWLDSPTTPAG